MSPVITSSKEGMVIAIYRTRSHPDESPSRTSPRSAAQRNKWNSAETFSTADDKNIKNAPIIDHPIQQASWGGKVPSQISLQRTTSDVPLSQLIGKMKEIEEESRQDHCYSRSVAAPTRSGDEESREDAALYRKCVTERRSSQITLRNDIRNEECKRTWTSSIEDVPHPRRSASWSPPHASSSFATQTSQENIYERLYHRSKPMQTDGKERRRAIAQRCKERHWVPQSEDFGKIPQSRGSDMYKRGMSYLRSKQLRLHDKKKEPPVNTPSRPKEVLECTRTSSEFQLSYQWLPCYNGIRTNSTDGRQLTCPSSSSICNDRKIPPSKAGDMYGRGIAFLHQKQARLQAKKAEGVSSRSQPPSRPKSICPTDGTYTLSYQRMPATSNNAIYTKGSINTMGTLSSNKHMRGGKKIPQSKAGDMYSRGMVFLRTKQSRLQSKKYEGSANHHTPKLTPPRKNKSVSNASGLYDRGIDFLEAKATKLEEKRLRLLDDSAKLMFASSTSCHTSLPKTKSNKSSKREKNESSGLQRIPAFLDYNSETYFQPDLNQDTIVSSWIADVEPSFTMNSRCMYSGQNMRRDEIYGRSHVESEDLSNAYSDEDSSLVYVSHLPRDLEMFSTRVQETSDPIPLKMHSKKSETDNKLCCSIGLF